MRSTLETRETAQAALDYIEAHPEQHEQNNWWTVAGADRFPADSYNICDTTMCVAGTAVWVKEGMDGMRRCALGIGTGFEKSGREYLGLSVREADALFYRAGNEEAVSMLRAIANGDEDKFWEIFKG